MSTFNSLVKLNILGAYRSLFTFILFATVFWVTATNATEYTIESKIIVENWEHDTYSDIPFLKFETGRRFDLVSNDIQPVNIIIQEDGSTRFQLSYSTPFGRTIFANVIKTILDNSISKITMMNISDGKQTMFFTSNDSFKPSQLLNKQLEQTLNSLVDQGAKTQVCLPCVYAAIIAAEAIACAAGSLLSSLQCESLCSATGMLTYESGICGAVDAKCICNPPPPKEVEDPTPGV